MEELDKVVGIRLKTFNDLVRLSASSIAMGQSTFILRIRNGSRNVYGVLAVFRDYYRMYGLPLLYYFIDSEGKIPEEANYVLLRSDEGGERIEFGKGSKAGYVTIPIINVAEVPEFIKEG
jgi:hypothetical protein